MDVEYVDVYMYILKYLYTVYIIFSFNMCI